MSIAPGTRLGPYEVLDLAGGGGMGEVYRARDTRLGRVVALKMITDAIGDDPQVRHRFEREARAIGALNHPNICAVHDVGTHDGRDFLVMEYVDGQTLTQRLHKGPLKPPELLTVAIEIAEALVAAHREGITHRDLKPSNVMLTRSGVKLVDFGIAKLHEPVHSGAPSRPEDDLTTTVATVKGTLIGTVPYMAPEQLEGRPVDDRTDIFSFGAVLFEMATGRPAFAGASTAALVAAILSESRPHLPDAAGRSRALDRIISGCLARNPDDRWQHAADVLILRLLYWRVASGGRFIRSWASRCHRSKSAADPAPPYRCQPPRQKNARATKIQKNTKNSGNNGNPKPNGWNHGRQPHAAAAVETFGLSARP
jgi:serine/threonine protein kinase